MYYIRWFLLSTINFEGQEILLYFLAKFTYVTVVGYLMGYGNKFA